MNNSLPITFNTRVPREIKMFIEMITHVYSEFEDIKWSRKSEIEFGFTYRNKGKGTEYFFGIWYDLWEQFGVPLSLCLSYAGTSNSDWYNKMKKYISSNYNNGIILKEFDGWICILFDYSFFKFDSGDDISTLVELYYDITEYGEYLVK